MSRPGSYYELFGLTPKASAAEIRAAYLSLVKRHHPDLRQHRAAESGPDMLPVINRCYAVLKNPILRAEYDASLSRAAASGERALQLVPRSQPRPDRRLKSFFAWGAIPVAALVGALFAGLWPLVEDPEFGVSSAATYESAERALPSDKQIMEQVRLATALPLRRIAEVANNCFRDARAQDDILQAQVCVVLDDAVLYWREDSSAVPYYDPRVVELRHSDALADFGVEMPQRLQALQNRAFLALLAEARNPSGPAAGSPAASPSVDDSARQTFLPDGRLKSGRTP